MKDRDLARQCIYSLESFGPCAMIAILLGMGSPQIVSAQDQSAAQMNIPTVQGANDVILNASERSTSDSAISLMVKLSANDLVEATDAVGVECTLRSGFLGGPGADAAEVGAGFAVFVRQGKSISSFAEPESSDTVAFFDDDSINVSVEVVFEPTSEDVPIELWTHGDCQLYLYKDTAQIPRPPRVCRGADFQKPYTGGSTDGLIACVWPGTDPVRSLGTFKREGFENFDVKSGAFEARNE